MAATATARWEGSLDDGSGTISTGAGLQGTYTKASRFADGTGTNPEELIGAAILCDAAHTRAPTWPDCRTTGRLPGDSGDGAGGKRRGVVKGVASGRSSRQTKDPLRRLSVQPRF